jgi:hypothetical protein
VRQRNLVIGGVLCACLVLIGLAVSGRSDSARTSPDRPLQTAIFDPNAFATPDAATAFVHARQTGSTVARIWLDWNAVAPSSPAGSSDPSSPVNPRYKWGPIDTQVKLAVKAGLQPILCVVNPPDWARKPGADGSKRLPQFRDPAGDYGAFVRAAARRYSGTFRGLPRVRYWQVLNEPNLSYYLVPQYVDGNPASPAIYRDLVNAAAEAVHAVQGDNVVIAGGMSPFSQGGPDSDPAKHQVAMAPLAFMRDVLCMSAGPNPRPTCNDTVTFDVWSHHPYTHGGPLDKASNAGNVSLGDLPAMKQLLDAAVKAHHVVSRAPVAFWVTEFSWDSKPTDPIGVPVRLEAQWVAEAMYQAWKSGVSLFTWFLVRDQKWGTGQSLQSSLFQPGKTIEQDTPKPAFYAFRFPFVGHPVNDKVVVWGRTPWGRTGRVLVEQLQNGRWTRLGIVTANNVGVFTRTFAAPTSGYVRARELRKGGLSAPPFPLAPLPDLHIQNPFGS